MKVGIIDADLIGRKKHNFPNLACMKISAWNKDKGNDVKLITDYGDIYGYDHIYISKVFTDTPFPDYLFKNSNAIMGGTGFYFDKAPPLDYEIEHHMPDYHLYDEWIQEQKPSKTKEYTDYSIGFLTRGCFRKCGFCVNQKYDHVFRHSPLEEFYDETRPKICLLDDNFLGCGQWKPMLQELIDTGKPFKFKQGLDERLLTEEKCEMLFSSKYDHDITFAFDKISDYDIIEKKLQLIKKYKTTRFEVKFYVLCGFESTGIDDIVNLFKRIELIMKYGCIPYVMRYQSSTSKPWELSPMRGMYILISSWCNQVSFYKKMSLREFARARSESLKSISSDERSLTEFEKQYPEYSYYLDMKYEEIQL